MNAHRTRTRVLTAGGRGGGRVSGPRPAAGAHGWGGAAAGRAEALCHRRALRATSARCLPRWVFPRVPASACSASFPHGAEHAQVRAALPGTWTSPLGLGRLPASSKWWPPLPPGPLLIRRRGSCSEPQHLPLRSPKFIRPACRQFLCSVVTVTPSVLSSQGLITTCAWVLQAFTQHLLGAVLRVQAGPH